MDITPRLPWTAQIISFDLFDTLLARSFAEPADVFLEVGSRLATAAQPMSEFVDARSAAEFYLREATAFRTEVTLEEIYSELARRLAWSSEQRSTALATELAVERETIYAVPAGLSLLACARRRGRRVIFISDTYLPKTFLEPLLSQLAIRQEGDGLYLSSEYRALKSEGSLFDLVAAAEKAAPRKFVHVGDNPESDGSRPRMRGWRTLMFKPTALTRYETPAVSPQGTQSLLLSRFSGLRRKLRLQSPHVSPRERTIYETTLAVSGPVVLAYTAWCLREAEARGLRRLYFLSRDGEILYRLAQRLRRDDSGRMDLRYLYVSRQALLLPALSEPLEAELSWIAAATAALTPRIVLKRVELSPEEIGAVLTENGFPHSTWDRQLSEERRQKFSKLLIAQPLRARLLQQARLARERTLEYLTVNGLMDEEPFAVVDIGWNGTLQRSLGRLLELAGRTGPTTGFYFGLHSRRRHRADDIMLAAFSDYQEPTRVDSIAYLIPLLELFVAAQHGGVETYETESGSCRPVLRHPENLTGLKWGVRIQQQAMLDLADAWLDAGFSDLPLPPLYDHLIDNLERFARTPSRAEALAYGCYLDAEDQNESTYTPLAQGFSLCELRRFRIGGFVHHHNEWRAGAVALTPALYRRWLRVENVLDDQHPILGEGLKTVRGCGPVEAPNPRFHLPRFMWLYGPECAIDIVSPLLSPTLLRLRLKNFHINQHLEFVLLGSVLTKLEVPQNFGEGCPDIFTMELILPPSPARFELAVRPTLWSEGDRPLAVILLGMELRPAGDATLPKPDCG